MSYSITIEKDADGVRITNTTSLETIPDGAITVNGHVPGPGLSLVANLGVALSGPVDARGLRQFVASASTAYATPPPAKPESEQAAEQDAPPIEG